VEDLKRGWRVDWSLMHLRFADMTSPALHVPPAYLRPSIAGWYETQANLERKQIHSIWRSTLSLQLPTSRAPATAAIAAAAAPPQLSHNPHLMACW
jgi:hypothetical protein